MKIWKISNKRTKSIYDNVASTSASKPPSSYLWFLILGCLFTIFMSFLVLPIFTHKLFQVYIKNHLFNIIFQLISCSCEVSKSWWYIQYFMYIFVLSFPQCWSRLTCCISIRILSEEIDCRGIFSKFTCWFTMRRPQPRSSRGVKKTQSLDQLELPNLNYKGWVGLGWIMF